MLPKIRKILYATDLSLNSVYAFQYAINSAEKHHADIIILHVLPMPTASTRALMENYFNEEQYEEILKNNTAAVIEKIKNKMKAFCETELKNDSGRVNRIAGIEVIQGYPADMILQMAEKHDCDAIVMGSHGKGIVAHAFLGSTSRKVLRRSRKPVFIIPLPEVELDITFQGIKEGRDAPFQAFT
jgi:nucleotide-binding universal stress UspA family protein